jgi:hypothetical protein
MGVHPFVAAAAGLALSAHPRVWLNLVAPEIYVFSIAFSLASVYCLLRYLALGRSLDLLASAFLIGVAIANRPPIILVVPFFLWAWWKSPFRPRRGARGNVGAVCTLALVASIPGIYSLAYFFVRDNPAAVYNYIEHHNAEARELPEAADGFAAKVRRVLWMASAEQFRSHLGNDLKRMRTKLRWLRYDCLGTDPFVAGGFLILTLAGLHRLARGSAPQCLVVVALGLQAFIYRLVYKDDGQAADMLPLLTCMAILAAAGAMITLNPKRRVASHALASLTLVLLIAFTLQDAPDRPRYARDVDATEYLGGVDVASLAPDAVVMTYWTHAPPLRYAQYVLGTRPDITIVTAQIANWRQLVEQHASRPVYVTTPSPVLPRELLTPEGRLFRVVRMPPATSVP